MLVFLCIWLLVIRSQCPHCSLMPHSHLLKKSFNISRKTIYRSPLKRNDEEKLSYLLFKWKNICKNAHFSCFLIDNEQIKCKYLLLNSIKTQKSSNFANLNKCVRTKWDEKPPFSVCDDDFLNCCCKVEVGGKLSKQNQLNNNKSNKKCKTKDL